VYDCVTFVVLVISFSMSVLKVVSCVQMGVDGLVMILLTLRAQVTGQERVNKKGT